MAVDNGRAPVVGDGTIRWVFTLLFGAGMAYASLRVAIQEVPKLSEKVQVHDVQFAVIETKMEALERGQSKIIRLLERRRTH